MREWICLDHEDFAGRKARRWWARRFGAASAETATVDSAINDLFVAAALKDMTRTITVERRGKHYEIVGYGLKEIR